MNQLIPSLATLVAAFSDCFHPQVFQTFQALLAGWIVCQGPRTISEVWLATGLAAQGLRISLGRLGVVGRSGPLLFCSPTGWASSPSCTIDRQDNPTASGTSAP
jgi:hypothetical protein